MEINGYAGMMDDLAGMSKLKTIKQDVATTEIQKENDKTNENKQDNIDQSIKPAVDVSISQSARILGSNYMDYFLQAFGSSDTSATLDKIGTGRTTDWFIKDQETSAKVYNSLYKDIEKKFSDDEETKKTLITGLNWQYDNVVRFRASVDATMVMDMLKYEARCGQSSAVEKYGFAKYANTANGDTSQEWRNDLDTLAKNLQEQAMGYADSIKDSMKKRFRDRSSACFGR